MKALTYISAFIGGAIAGCAAALLFAPEKGADVSKMIVACIRKKGINKRDSEVDALVAELAGSED